MTDKIKKESDEPDDNQSSIQNIGFRMETLRRFRIIPESFLQYCGKYCQKIETENR
jgi:hypothetical protein